MKFIAATAALALLIDPDTFVSASPAQQNELADASKNERAKRRIRVPSKTTKGTSADVSQHRSLKSEGKKGKGRSNTSAPTSAGHSRPAHRDSAARQEPDPGLGASPFCPGGPLRAESGEGVAVAEIAGLEPLPQPFRPLLGRAVREGLGMDDTDPLVELVEARSCFDVESHIDVVSNARKRVQ